MSGLPCPCCQPRLPLLSTSPSLATSPILPGGLSPDPKPEPGAKPNDPEASANEETDKSNFLQSSVNKDLLFGASVAELRRKAQEHSAALWQSLQLAQQQSIAATTSLATALTNSSAHMSNPFLVGNSDNNKEINFNFLPTVSGFGGLAGLGFPSHFSQQVNPPNLSDSRIVNDKEDSEKECSSLMPLKEEDVKS